MSDKGFKRFIETGGKSPDEIRQEIRRLLGDAVDSVKNAADAVDETLRSTAEDIRRRISEVVSDAGGDSAPKPEKIPPRERDNIHYAKKPAQTLSADEIAFAPDRFPVKLSENDRRINEIIAKMRQLNEVFYNGYLLKECAEVSIVRQGEYLADITDSYEHKAFCGIPRPVYGAMSNSQIRTYLTWRTNARNGLFAPIDRAYVVLYCYELLNKIGVMSAADAMGRLLEVWERCREFCPEIKGSLPRWIKDFYAYNDVSENFPDISGYFSENEPEAAVTDLYEHRYAGHLDYFAEHSAYKFRESSFFADGSNIPLLDGALSRVWDALDEFFAQRGLALFRLICGRMKKEYGWEPFSGAYVDIDRMDGFREVKISSVERYCKKRGAPTLETFEEAPFCGFIGYVIKLTESVLRKQTGCRHKITPNLVMAQKDFTNLEKHLVAVSDPEFPAVIERAAEGWCRENRIFPAPKKTAREREMPEESESVSFEIDVNKLGKIREESDEIARKLIVEEAGELAAEEIGDISERVSDEFFSEQVTDSLAEAEEQREKAPAAESRFDFSELPKQWRAFAERLNETQIGLLAALTRGTAQEYCHRYGIFPETVYEEINTAALDETGDIVLEGGELIPDYERSIRKLVALADV